MSNFKLGDRVTFKPGPKSTADVSGEVVNLPTANGYLEVKCDDGKTRKTRPGSCRAA